MPTPSQSRSRSPSPAKSAAKAKKVKKPAAKKSGRPTTLVMVTHAIVALKDKKGSSAQAIKKYVMAHYPGIPVNFVSSMLKRAFAAGLKSGALVRPKGSTAVGASGRFRIGKVAAPKKKAAPKKAKKVVKKAKKVVKKAAKKPASKTKKVKKAKTLKKKPAAKKAKTAKKVLKKKPVKKATKAKSAKAKMVK